MPDLTVMVHTRDETTSVGVMVEGIFVGLEIVVINEARHRS